MKDDIKVYYSIRETSQRYSVGVSTIYSWIQDARFPKPNRLGPKLARFHINDLLRWEEQQIECDINNQEYLWKKETDFMERVTRGESD